MNNVQFIIQVCKGLIRKNRARRILMFYSVIFAIVLAFAGVTGLWPLLRNHPFIFLCYWAACAWLTLLASLLALYDMARVRQEARRERERLRQEYLDAQELQDTASANIPLSKEKTNRAETER